ncbi:uncharacterized protein LAJ45_03703 [Morchella importuna]|uniref:uncharacterized protein n=1 Tax=Morchella importuna TaxID=1174673 RepID=UPI001E8E2AE4|nr:uncharacterized protein LAJ45_03703 [Morchella importuna]KAH8152277.1 hypothetical protein LAJ45_03703 [Morchella importuna]
MDTYLYPPRLTDPRYWGKKAAYIYRATNARADLYHNATRFLDIRNMLKFTWPLGKHLDVYAAREADAAPFEREERVQMVGLIEGMWVSVVERFAFYGLVGQGVSSADELYWAEVRAFYAELGRRVTEVVFGDPE